MSAMPSAGGTVPAHARPTNVGVPMMLVSASIGGTPLPERAVNSVPVCGPDVISATTRYDPETGVVTTIFR
jgi:hypothetical protein